MTNYFLIVNCEFCILNCSQLRSRLGCAKLVATRKGGRKRCSGGCGLLKYNPASAVRAEAPPCGGSQNSPRWLRHENNTAPTEAELANLQPALFLNAANAVCGVRPAKAEAASRRTTKNGGRTTVRKQLFLINPPAPLRRQRTAESADLAGGSRGLRHSGPWNCFCRKRKTKIVCRKNSNA